MMRIIRGRRREEVIVVTSVLYILIFVYVECY